MAVFAYKAVDLDLSPVAGTVIADTPRQARDELRAKGLTVQEVVGKAAPQPRADLLARWSKRRLEPKVASFIRELSTLLGAGIPTLEALDSIADQHRGGFRTSLLLLRDRVCAGVALAEAMAEQPLVFDELCASITEVGEHSGNLDVVLAQLAEFKDRSGQFRSRLTTALVYPCLVLVMGVAVSVFLMTYVVPELLSTLVASGRPLPFATRVVKAGSDFLLQRWWLLGTAALTLAMALALVLRTPRGLRLWHVLQLRLPLVGEIVRKQDVARIAVVLSTLLTGGVVLLRAVQIAQRSTRNLVLREALAKFEAGVGAGQELAAALEGTRVFPRTVVQILSVGQESGRLEEMLDRLAADYDRELATAAQRFTAALEPLLIVCLAVVVGFIAFATILPILEAGNAI